MAPRRPTSTGRKKIEIRRIESEEARHICFSKRRAGLFNKVSELSSLCGAEVAAVVFSPGGKAFSLGHPSVDSVLDRFCTSNSSEAQAVEALDGGDSDRNLELAELNRELGELRAQLAAIKARKEAADESLAKARTEGCQAAAWLDTEVSQMGEEDMVAFAAALAKVRADVAARSDQVLQDALLFGRPVHGGGGGEFELGGTSASGGMEMTQQQLMMMTGMARPLPPTGFAAGAEMIQQQQMMMAIQPPSPTGFDAGTQMMQQQQQQMMMAMLLPQTGFDAGTEMMQQQQQQQQQDMMMAMPPPPTGFAAGMETMQQQMMMGMLPPLPGFANGMEMMPQWF